MKNLANNITNATYETQDTKIETIARASALPDGFTPSTANAISLSSSLTPVYIFFDEPSGTMYYYSESEKINMNNDSSRMFYHFLSLTNIDALSSWNTSNVENMSYMFYPDYSLTNINGASSRDTSNVTNISRMFAGAYQIDATVLNNWNVSNVTDKTEAFISCPEDKWPSWY